MKSRRWGAQGQRGSLGEPVIREHGSAGEGARTRGPDWAAGAGCEERASHGTAQL